MTRPIALFLLLAACRPDSYGRPIDDDDGADRSANGGTIAATSSTDALDAGLDVLDEGGSAVDAALVTAMVQIVRTGGSWNSFAGILCMVALDGESGEVTALHGGYDTFENETDPASIPASGPSGRTALVPGFMAAAQAAHDAHGLLPWDRIAAPAIALAEDGFEVDRYLAWTIETKWDVLSRRDETRAVFINDDGEPYQEGDLFRQPALAETLRAVAEQGATYMYTGEWADRFVDAVGEEGGAVTAEDLATYDADWLPPLEGEIGGKHIYGLGERSTGSVQIIEAMHMAEASGLAGLGPWSESGEALYQTVRITQVNQLLTWFSVYYPEYQGYVTDWFPGVSLDAASRTDPAQAALLAGYVEDGTFGEFAAWLGYEGDGRGTHSDAIAVIDARGDAVALTHSINTSLWGYTGIFVDGVSIPDSAAFQQALLEQVEPGEPLPTALNPVVVTVDGAPVLAASTIGNIHYAQFLRLHAVLGLGMAPEDAVELPLMGGYAFHEVVEPFTYDDEVLAEAAGLGTPITESTETSAPGWVGVDGTLDGAIDPWLDWAGGGVGSTGL